MSGCSDNSDCPRCLGKNTLEVYSDWKPFDMTTGLCNRCGFMYSYTFTADKKNIEFDEENYEKDTLEEIKRELTEEEKKHIKEFDREFGVEK